MTKPEKINRLCNAIIQETKRTGWEDFQDKSYNLDAHINITLTVFEVRMAADIINYKAKNDSELIFTD